VPIGLIGLVFLFRQPKYCRFG